MRLLRVLTELLVGHGSDPQVTGLRADPMAGWSRPGLSQVREYVTKPGSTLGKPRYAQILRILEVQDGSSVVSVLREVRRSAEYAGWLVTFEHRSGAFSAEKRFSVEGHDLRARLSSGPQDVGGPPGAVEVYLMLVAYPA